MLRRLTILYLVGTLLLPAGLSESLTPTTPSGTPGRVVGLVGAPIGATLPFAGLVGAVFEIVADANVLATRVE